MRTITREKYESLRRHGYAGESWVGDRWAMWHEPGVGTVLDAVHVDERGYCPACDRTAPCADPAACAEALARARRRAEEGWRQ